MKFTAVCLFLFLGFAMSASHAALPAENPEAAIFVTSCHQIVHVVIVMPGGKALFFDGHSPESADEVKALAERSREPPRVYEVGCYREKPVSV